MRGATRQVSRKINRQFLLLLGRGRPGLPFVAMGYGVPDSGVDFAYVSVQEAYLLMKNDKAVFVDSRDEDDYKTSRLQTSFHLPANALIMKGSSVEKSLVQHLIDLVNSGKTLICLSDACIKGNVNRGHVSRCRHIAQYLVELGADRSLIVRMAGGINAWKRAQLDGILGELRPMYAGEIQNWDFAPPKLKEEESEDEALPEISPAKGAGGGYVAALSEEAALAVGQQIEISGLKTRAELNGKAAIVKDFVADSGRWEIELLDETKERLRCKPESLLLKSAKQETPKAVEPAEVEVGCGGVVTENCERITCKVRWVPSRPFRQDQPTAYRVLKSDLFKKPNVSGDKIIKISRPVSSTVRTTGELFVGASGGIWAELDVTAGEKKGWIYVKGPGFGASSCKVTSEYLQA
ncbi:unnamed protein product [Durusdinium trenchii]|uniref:Rhodanese domain-containing protein n=1 Tax=Durusdinium trenchii TaxID=1381693 RepID=A0ABP0LGF0_9DINO